VGASKRRNLEQLYSEPQILEVPLYSVFEASLALLVASLTTLTRPPDLQARDKAVASHGVRLETADAARGAATLGCSRRDSTTRQLAVRCRSATPSIDSESGV
jgi:hypothetical protein